MLASLVFLLCFNATVSPQQLNHESAAERLAQRSSLSGLYRIDIPASDKLYSVVAGASSNVPFAEQQRFFIDLAVRLTPPDLIAIEQENTRVSFGSSRAPRMNFEADGIARNTRATDGHLVRVRFAVERAGENARLVFTSSGRTEDNFTVTFESFDNGRRLRVVRRISAEKLDRPLIIRTVYNKISDVAHWDLYSESHVASAAVSSPEPRRDVAAPEDNTSAANALRSALTEWVAATNNRDINKQMSFYAPRLNAYYLTRNTSQDFVRDEKSRVFSNAAVIDIRAEEPEIIFQDSGRTAIMRYRKKYRVENGRLSRQGEVIQELRWRRVGQEWRIFSERDIKVL